MADPDFVSDLQYVLARRGNKIIHQQSCFLQSTVSLDPPAMEEEGIEDQASEVGVKRPIQVEQGNPGTIIVNVDVGGTSGLGSVADQSARPAGAGRPKKQGITLPTLISAVVKFGLGEIDIAAGAGDSPDAALATIRAHGSMWGAYMARALIDPSLPEPSGTTAAGATSFTVPRTGGWIEGATVDVVLDSTGAVLFQFDIKLVKGNFDGTATVVVNDGVTGLAGQYVSSTMSMYLKGQSVSTTRLGAMVDLTDSTQNLYGLDVNNDFPSGLVDAVGGPWSNSDGLNAVAILAATGDQPTAWHTSKRGRAKIVNAQTSNVRFIPGMGDNNRDPFKDAMIPEFAGLPIIGCNQGDDTVVRLGNWNRFKLLEMVKYGPELPSGGERGEMGKSSLFTSEGSHAKKLLLSGWYKAVTDKRRCFLSMTGLT